MILTALCRLQSDIMFARRARIKDLQLGPIHKMDTRPKRTHIHCQLSRIARFKCTTKALYDRKVGSQIPVHTSLQ